MEQRCLRPFCWEYIWLGRRTCRQCGGRSCLWRNIKIAKADLRPITTTKKWTALPNSSRICDATSMTFIVRNWLTLYETSIHRFKVNGEQSADTAKQKNWSTGRKWQNKRQQHEANKKRIISSGTSSDKDEIGQESLFLGSPSNREKIESYSFFCIHYICITFKIIIKYFCFSRYSKSNGRSVSQFPFQYVILSYFVLFYFVSCHILCLYHVETFRKKGKNTRLTTKQESLCVHIIFIAL